MSDYYATAGLGDRERAVLAEPRLAVVSTVSPNGDPHSVPCWFRFDDDRFVMSVHSQARRAKNVATRSRARVLIEHPSGWVSAVGPASLITGGDVRSLQDRIGEKYLTPSGQQHFVEASGIPDDAVLEVRPERWMSWDMIDSAMPKMLAAGFGVDEIMGWFKPMARRDR